MTAAHTVRYVGETWGTTYKMDICGYSNAKKTTNECDLCRYRKLERLTIDRKNEENMLMQNWFENARKRCCRRGYVSDECECEMVRDREGRCGKKR